jgi:hypothetical protein
MKHLKLFEGFEELKYATLRFNGVIPDNDPDAPGHWSLVVRRIKVPYSACATSFGLEYEILENLRSGKFEIESNEYDPPFYWGEALGKGNIKGIASGVKTVKEFWDVMERELISNGIQGYHQEYGSTDEEKVERMKEINSAPLDDWGCNIEAFIETWRLNSSVNIHNFLEY